MTSAMYSVKGYSDGSGNKGNGSGTVIDKTKEWQMELLMEKLRSKAGQFKSFAESAKALRMSLLEKRYPVDSMERNQLQKCLDTLQHSIRVTSLQGMVERLESVTRQLGLKFMAGATGLDWFISSDMFYVEVVLEASGAVKDVTIHHEGKVEQQSCEELVACLSSGDFDDFTAQLEGLTSIYQLNAEKKVKCRAFSALQSLETDLGSLAQLQTFIREPFNLVHKSTVGILEKRRGGHAMKLTYLVSPYDLLDPKTQTSIPLSVEEVTSRNLGYSVLVCMEGCTAHKLQTAPLITVTSKSSPVYAPLTSANSATLPACFVLRLNHPLPTCLTLVHRIQQITEMECGDVSSPHPMLSLVTQHASAGQLDCANNRGLFVSLPDQHHCYFMTESRSLEGILVTNIPFSHPAHVPQILALLRQQALFNTLVSSCVRPQSKQDLESMTMLEVTALSWQHLSVSFEHPLEETMATAELDLTDLANVKCKVYGSGGDSTTTPEHVSKVLQRCLSIPVTMRSLIRTWECEPHRANGLGTGGTLGLPPGSDPGRGGSNGHPDFDVSRVKTEPDSSRQGFSADMSPAGGFQSPLPHQAPDLAVSANSFQLSSLLGDRKGPALLSLLGEGGSGNKKQRKRKGSSAADNWRSPKRKPSEDCEIFLESSSSDSTPLGTPTAREPPAELADDSKPGSDDEIMELDEVEDRITVWKTATVGKKEKKSLILDLGDNKSLVPPSVSITPIPAQGFSSVLTGMGLERRPGIEIIPIVSTPAASLPSSITITPIKAGGGDDRSRSKGGPNKPPRPPDDRSRDKKRRRKRDDEMGPPDKLPPSKQDPLSKPVSVSIKPTPTVTADPPKSGAGGGTKPPSSHQSPKHSPGYATSSPKHHGTSSPKHQSSGGSGKPSMSALKSAASSPSGKGPDIKTKASGKDKDRNKVSSGSSPKLKSSSVKLKQLDLSGDGGGSGGATPPSGGSGSDGGKSAPQMRNRKGSLSAVIDKLKSAQEVGVDVGPPREGGRGSNTGSKGAPGEGGSSKVPGEYMVKPSSDGLKLTINKSRTKDSKSSSSLGKSSSGTGSPKTHTGLKPGVNSGPASKKPHPGQQQKSPGKTGTGSVASSKMSSNPNKSSSSPVAGLLSKSGSKSSSGSPKIPSSGNSGVTRGDGGSKPRPAKSSGDKSVFGGSSKGPDVRKSSPVSLRDETEGERAFKLLAAHAKLEGPPTIPPQLVVKTLDTKFQIPKLSARNNNSSQPTESSEVGKKLSDKPGEASKPPPIVDLSGDQLPVPSKFQSLVKPPQDDVKVTVTPISLLGPNVVKGLAAPGLKPLTLPASIAKNVEVVNLDVTVSQAISSVPSVPMMESSAETAEPLRVETVRGQQASTGVKDESKGFPCIDPPMLSIVLTGNTKSSDSPLNKFPTPKLAEDMKKLPELKLNPGGPTTPQEAAEMLLDFSSSVPAPVPLPVPPPVVSPVIPPPVELPPGKLTTVPERALGVAAAPGRRNTPPPVFPNSPSVSVHIVKSPAPSPLVIPSPHSASPCITDDELMDEALVGK